MQIREKVGKSCSKYYIFPIIYGSGGSKSTLVKAAGAEPARQISDLKLYAIMAQNTFPNPNI